MSVQKCICTFIILNGWHSNVLRCELLIGKKWQEANHLLKPSSTKWWQFKNSKKGNPFWVSREKISGFFDQHLRKILASDFATKVVLLQTLLLTIFSRLTERKQSSNRKVRWRLRQFFTAVNRLVVTGHGKSTSIHIHSKVKPLKFRMRDSVYHCATELQRGFSHSRSEGFKIFASCEWQWKHSLTDIEKEVKHVTSGENH